VLLAALCCPRLSLHKGACLRASLRLVLAEMPFVPLGSRKNLGVLLDHDKELITGKMRLIDNATVAHHNQVMAGTRSVAHLPVHASYRYAKHPETLGPVRGPPPPFQTANKPWAPAEEDPDGGHALRETEHAPVGACRDGGHCFHGETLRKSRSTPAMVKTLAKNSLEEGESYGEQAKKAGNPLTIELNRWNRMAEITKREMEGMPELHSLQKSFKPPMKKPAPSTGLVNFPKYMLFENSHLKSQDNMRFVAAEELARAENEARHAALQEAMDSGEASPLSPCSTSRSLKSRETRFSEAGSTKTKGGHETQLGAASWGQPRLRGKKHDIQKQWAGSAMASGKTMCSSNPFRMG